jgi:hypothetical protein
LPQHSGRSDNVERFQPPPSAWASVTASPLPRIFRAVISSRESCTLGGCHLQVTRDATLVASDCELQVFLRCGNCCCLNLRFVLEDPQRCDVVLDLLKAGQDRLAVVGDCLVVGPYGLIRVGPAPAGRRWGPYRSGWCRDRLPHAWRERILSRRYRITSSHRWPRRRGRSVN